MTRRPDPRRGARTVLIVEDHAHWLMGHFPVRFAQLAEGYVEAGYHVEVLTSWGWSAAQEHPHTSFRVHRFGWTARQFRRIASWLRGRGTSTPLRRFAVQAGAAVAHVSLVAAVRARRRRLAAVPDATVLLGWNTDPVMVAALAGPGRWLWNQFQTPEEAVSWDIELVAKFVRVAARRAERRRRSMGGCFRIAVADESWRDAWTVAAPFLEPVVLRIAGVRPLPRVPDARARLGLASAGKLALLFGSEHWAKRLDAPLAAFERLDGWTLVLAGEVARRADASQVEQHELVVFPGRVDDATRDLLLSAADVMVLSFTRNYRSDSGTLMDAISVGVPVVCSAESAAAELVETYRLGACFTPDDAASLAEAVGRVPDHIAPEDLARARAMHSNRAVACDQLLALALDDVQAD